MKRKGGARRQTRHLMSKHFRTAGKIPLRRLLATFKIGEEVVLLAEPAVQGGMYFLRFHGRQGVVKSKMGSCYNVVIHDGDKEKTVIVHPVHLRRRV